MVLILTHVFIARHNKTTEGWGDPTMPIDPVLISETTSFGHRRWSSETPASWPPRPALTRLTGTCVADHVVSVFWVISPAPLSFVVFIVVVTAYGCVQRIVATLFIFWKTYILEQTFYVLRQTFYNLKSSVTFLKTIQLGFWSWWHNSESIPELLTRLFSFLETPVLFEIIAISPSHQITRDIHRLLDRAGGLFRETGAIRRNLDILAWTAFFSLKSWFIGKESYSKK